MVREFGRPSPSRGFVLMFVLGILIVLATLVTGASLANRQRLTETAVSRSLLQTHSRLYGALQAVMAKLHLDHELAAAISADSSAGRGIKSIPEPWSPAEDERLMLLEGNAFRLGIAQATWFPDANALSVDDWSRLLTALGVDGAQAAVLAKRLAAKRDLLRNIGAGRGFTNFYQILDGLALPPSVLFGSRNGREPGLIDLISLGTESRETDPMHTPWIIYRALYNATDSQIKRLQAKRSAGSLTKTLEAEILNVPTSGGQLPQSPSPPVLMLRIVVNPAGSTAAVSPSIGLIGFVKIQASEVSLQTQYLFFRE